MLVRLIRLPLFLAALLLAMPAAQAAELVGQGSFVGASNHETSGAAKLVLQPDGTTKVELGEDFSHDGAPDPRVGLGHAGEYDPKSDLGELKSLTGGQSYGVPSSIDLNSYDEVYIWCRKFNVPLGVAKISR